MLQRIKDHLFKGYNFVFWLLFAPAMAFTLWGVSDLYMNHFDELTKQDHMQFFLRFFFPVALATFVTILERRQQMQKQDLIKRGNDYLSRKRSIK
jgi:EamA domain-containing membrane protein RarD